MSRRRITSHGVPYNDEQYLVKVPGYCVKADEFDGYHIEKGMYPRTKAAAWLKFSRWSGDTGKTAGESIFRYEVMRAT